MIEELARATIALIVVMDPIGLVPIIVSLTSGIGREEQKKMLKVTLYAATAILISFAIVGQQVLNLFSISIANFSVAGGLLLLILSLQLLLKGFDVYAGKEDIAVIPLAFPLLVGPGAITVLMLSLQKYGIVIALSSAFIAIIFTALVFWSINSIYRILGRTGSLIVAKIMAILTAAIAVDFIVEGLRDIIKSFYA